MPYKRIAAQLGVSPNSVFNWTHDIEITEEQRKRNLAHMSPNTDVVRRRAETWRMVNRVRRLEYQVEGRVRARAGEPLHQAGCMLYWAEGAKDRNGLLMANSDVNMVRLFVRFLRECFQIPDDEIAMRLNVYLGNGLSIGQIENRWLDALDLPRSCFGVHTINHFPTSSSGRKRNKLPHGVCSIRVRRSTHLVQHIFGAIQEYGSFDEPNWLDGPPRKKPAA